jgi:acetyl esterase/lipase
LRHAATALYGLSQHAMTKPAFLRSPSILAAALATAAPGASAQAQRPPLTLDQYMQLSGRAPDATAAYGPAPQQRMELFRPAGRGPFPVVFLIHGGCFHAKYQGVPQMRGMAAALAAKGVAVWNIDYRAFDQPGGAYPGTYLDAAAALDAVVARAAADRLDLGRLVLVGHSAGGYLAQWLAGRAEVPAGSPLHAPNPPRPRAVISLGYGDDFQVKTAAGEEPCGYPSAAFAGAAGGSDTFIPAVSPGAVPVTLMAGEFETFSTPAAIAASAKRMQARGSSVRTITLPGESHYGEVDPGSPAWPLVETAILAATRR